MNQLQQLKKENVKLKKSISNLKKKESSKKLSPEFYKKAALLSRRQTIAKQQGIKQARQQILQEQLRKAPVRASTQQLALQEQQAQLRQRKIGIMGSRAEQLEIQAVSFNEVPMLHDMERQRTRLTSPPDRNLVRIEKEVTDSFPD